jgi:hypothetical protein
LSISSSESGPGYELPLLLLAGFRAVIDEAHEELAARGHPELRPAHGFAMQAIAELGYVERGGESADRRRKLVRLTARGTEALTLSAEAFEHVRARWTALLGADRVAALEADLRKTAPGQALRLDVPGWLAG